MGNSNNNILTMDLYGVMGWSVDKGLELNVGKYFVLHTDPSDIVHTLNESGRGVELNDVDLKNCVKQNPLGLC